MEPKYQKAYAIEGIAKKWIEGENEDDYVDTGDMLDDFRLVLEISRELMTMLDPCKQCRHAAAYPENCEGCKAVNAPCIKCGRTDKWLYFNRMCTECYYPTEKNEKAEEPTLTIFRKYPDDTIVALFPEVKGAPGMCTSYVHVGQHSSAYYHHVIQTTKRATPEEYADLATELKSIGYDLKVRQKWIRRRC